MKNTLLIYIFFSLNYCFSQTITQEVISFTGGHYISNEGSLQFNIGEVLTESYQNPTAFLLQGFEQGNYDKVSVEQISNVLNNVLIFPNPTKSIVNVILELPISFEIEILDISGKIIGKVVAKHSTMIDMTEFSSGMYIINIKSIDYQVNKIFKITKYE